MGFLDKLLGKAKETASDVAEKAAPVIDKAQETAGQAWDKAKERVGDKADDATDAAETAADEVGAEAGEATDAVSKWQFEPRMFMGRSIEQSAYTRIRFVQ